MPFSNVIPTLGLIVWKRELAHDTHTHTHTHYLNNPLSLSTINLMWAQANCRPQRLSNNGPRPPQPGPIFDGIEEFVRYFHIEVLWVVEAMDSVQWGRIWPHPQGQYGRKNDPTPCPGSRTCTGRKRENTQPADHLPQEQIHYLARRKRTKTTLNSSQVHVSRTTSHTSETGRKLSSTNSYTTFLLHAPAHTPSTNYMYDICTPSTVQPRPTTYNLIKNSSHLSNHHQHTYGEPTHTSLGQCLIWRHKLENRVQ